ncbi:MAG: GIY-YIG nuclease family protein [Gemmatimonadales bacterium]
MPQRQFFVYILASGSRVLYTATTRDLPRRVHQHRLGLVQGFAKECRVNRLVHFEEMRSARSAFKRERQIKGWSRGKKIRLIESVNARWLDLAKDWFPTDEWLAPRSSRGEGSCCRVGCARPSIPPHRSTAASPA